MRRIILQECQPNMQLARAIYNERGELLLAAGSALTERRIQSLGGKGFSSLVVEDPETDGIEIPEVVSSAVRAQAKKKLATTFEYFSNISADFAGKDLAAIEDGLSSNSFRAQASAVDPLANLMSEVQAMIDEIMNADTLDGMNALMIHDDYTFQHSVDVAIVSAMIGKKMALPGDRLTQLTLGAMLHDLGKVFIPLDIIQKPGRLSEEEFARIKTHPSLGWKMLRASSGGGENVLAHHVCYQHHERQDGAGYPRGLKGNNQVGRPNWARFDPDRLHLMGEIGAVADTYEALSAERPYRPAFPSEKVRGMLTDMAGPHLNKEVLKKALEVIPSYSTGTDIEVISGPFAGGRGIVAKVDASHLHRPVIRLLRNAAGNRIDPVEIDLLAADYQIRSAPKKVPEKAPVPAAAG